MDKKHEDILMMAGQAGNMTIASLVAFAEVSGYDLVVQFIDKKKSPIQAVQTKINKKAKKRSP